MTPPAVTARLYGGVWPGAGRTNCLADCAASAAPMETDAMATLVRRMIVPRGESLLASRHSSTVHTPLSGYNPAHPMHAHGVRVRLVRVGLAAALTLIAAAAVRAQQQPTSGIGTVVSASPMYLTP